MKSPTYAEQCAATCREPSPSAPALRAAEQLHSEGQLRHYAYEQSRNARIVEAASVIDRETGLPELLEALKRAANHLIMTGTRNADAPEAIAQARAAIAKAQGTP